MPRSMFPAAVVPVYVAIFATVNVRSTITGAKIARFADGRTGVTAQGLAVAGVGMEVEDHDRAADGISARTAARIRAIPPKRPASAVKGPAPPTMQA